ncbi:hypothetical protein V8F20_002567 [Naviculisporaceae sp. PSN 640]
MARRNFDSKIFIVLHYQAPSEKGNESHDKTSGSDSTKTELRRGAKPEAELKGILPSSSSVSLKGILASPSSPSHSRTSSDASTPTQFPTPSASTFKQVKWLDSPTNKRPASLTQTPGGHYKDHDTDYITLTAASATNQDGSSTSTTTRASSKLKESVPRHMVTHYWQEHILLEDPTPGRRWPGRHGNNRAHSRSMPEVGDHFFEKAGEWHISARELEMSLEKYEREGRRSARRRQRTQSVYLPVRDYDDGHDVDHEWGSDAGSNYTYARSCGNHGTGQIQPRRAADRSVWACRRWSDVHRLAAQAEGSSFTLEATEFGRFGKLGVGK